MNVKQGDLAIQINAFRKENIGGIVEVISGWGEWKGNYLWNIRIGKDLTTTCYETGIERQRKAGSIIQCRDTWLRPVSGLPDEQTEEESNKLEV